MKKLLLLSLIVGVSSCASDFDKREVQYAYIRNASDPQIRLSLLEKQKAIDCQTYLIYYNCAQTTAIIAGIATLQTKHYDLAIQNAEQSFRYLEKYNNKQYNYRDRREDFESNCFSTWSFDAGFSNDMTRKLPKAFPMIYYEALKGAKDPRSKENLNMAYLCELVASHDSSKKEQILQDYIQSSMQLHDAPNQVYVKRFVNEIYKPIQQSTNQFYKNYSINPTVRSNEMVNAKIVVLYRNALIQAKKIGLPQIFQDYLNYYIYLYDQNK